MYLRRYFIENTCRSQDCKTLIHNLIKYVKYIFIELTFPDFKELIRCLFTKRYEVKS